MTLPDVNIRSISVLEAAEDTLSSDSFITLAVARTTLNRGNDPTMAAPPAVNVEIMSEDVDADSPPQAYPTIRLDILSIEQVTGVNNGVANTRHTLQMRSFHETSDTLATSLAAGKRTLSTTAQIRARAESRAYAYALEQGLVNYQLSGVWSGIYNVAQVEGPTVSQISRGAGMVLRVTQAFDVWQRTRSGRFAYPLA